MKISVIIPIYNVEQYLERCLDSICNQTHNDLEIILINDGSTDNSLIIAENFSKKDSRIYVVSQKNQGVSVARNRGIEMATGAYIAFVDPDDYVDLKYYDLMLNSIGSADLVVCNYHNTTNSGFLPLQEKTYFIEKLTGFESLNLLFDKKYTNSVIGVVIWNKLYKRELFDDLRFNKEYRRSQDEEIIFKIYLKCKKIAIINQKLYYYFQRPNNKVRLALGYNKQSISNRRIACMYQDRITYAENKEIFSSVLLITLLNIFIEYYLFSKNEDEKNQYHHTFSNYYNKLFFEIKYKNKIDFRTFIRFSMFNYIPNFYNKLIKKFR